MVSSSAAAGAPRRSRPPKASSSSARALARSRSGRGGWPGGTRCSRKIGSLTRSVDKCQAPSSVLAVEERLERVACLRRTEELGERARFLVDAGDHLAPFATQEAPRRAHRLR